MIRFMYTYNMKHYSSLTNGLILFFVLAVFGFAAIFAFTGWGEYEEITNFDECAEAGYPILESYPRQCIDGVGNTFVEELNETLLTDSTLVIEGTLLTGDDVGRSYCSEGIYISNDEGVTYLLKDLSGELYESSEYLNSRVKITGLAPESDVFCEALLCQCEEYLSVSEIREL